MRREFVPEGAVDGFAHPVVCRYSAHLELSTTGALVRILDGRIAANVSPD